MLARSSFLAKFASFRGWCFRFVGESKASACFSPLHNGWTWELSCRKLACRNQSFLGFSDGLSSRRLSCLCPLWKDHKLQICYQLNIVSFTFGWLLESSWDFGCEDVGLSLKFPFFYFSLVIARAENIALFGWLKRLAIDSRPETLNWSFQEFFGVLLNNIIAWTWIRLNRECHSLGLRVKRHTLLEEMFMLERRLIDFIERNRHIFLSFAFLKSLFGRPKALVLVFLWFILLVTGDIVWAWSWFLTFEILIFPKHESLLILRVVDNSVKCSDGVGHKEIRRVLFCLLADCSFIVWSRIICAWAESQRLMSLEAMDFVLAPISNAVGFLF